MSRKASNNAAQGAFTKDDYGAIIGANVHRLRTQQAIPKKTFALMIDIGRPLLDKIEDGSSDLRISYLVRIADGLSVSVVDLLTPHN